MGPIKESYHHLTDANWNEKAAAIILLVGIIAIGVAPFWLKDLISPGAAIIMQKISLVK
jgi:NADH-quinone oxidoreductase subunit M